MNSNHPCFNKDAHSRFGRIHLPVAPKCNIQCGYCDRRYSCVNESRPGVTTKVTTPAEALALTLRAVETLPNLSVAGIAGPGDPLANPDETLETLFLIHRELPELLLCLSTNGLALPEYAEELARLGVGHITVTLNAVEPAIGALIYRNVAGPAGKLAGQEAAALLLERQLAGIAKVKELGLVIKINMVIVPGINDSHTEAVARRVAAEGADMMNCIPLAPVPGTPLAHISEPGAATMANVRAKAEKWLPQMRHCSRCRADALGLLGEKRVIGDLYTPEMLEEIKPVNRANQF